MKLIFETHHNSNLTTRIQKTYESNNLKKITYYNIHKYKDS